MMKKYEDFKKIKINFNFLIERTLYTEYIRSNQYKNDWFPNR